MPIQEVRTIPDIRERSDRPKDKQPKHQVASTVQRQMVQKFVKELNDSAKQPDRSDSAEHTATEQVETTAREIVHEAVQLPRSFSRQATHAETPEHLQPERACIAAPNTGYAAATHGRLCAPDRTPLPRSTPTPTPQEQGRRAYIQQAAKAAATPPITPESPQERPAPAVPTRENVPRQNLQSPRQRTEDIRTRPESRTPQSAPAPAPQEQGRRAYIQQAAKAAAAPPITPESPQEHPAPVVPTLENVPRQVPKRTPVSAQTIYDCALSQMHHSTLHPQHHKSLGGVHLYGKQRNPAQKKRPRRIFTQSHQKFVLRKIFPSVNRRASVKSQRSRSCVRDCRLNRRQRKRRTFGISSRLVHGRRATLNLLTRVGRTTYPRTHVDVPPHDLPPTPQKQARKIFAEKQAQLSRSIHRIYPSTRIGCPQFHRSCPFRTCLRSRQSVSRSRLAAANRPHLSSHQAPAQAPPAEQPPAIREKPKPNAAPRRSPGVAFLFDKRYGADQRTKGSAKTSVSKIDTKRARKAATQDAQRKMLKRATTARPEQPPQPQKKLGEAAAKAVKELISALLPVGWRHGAFSSCFPSSLSRARSWHRRWGFSLPTSRRQTTPFHWQRPSRKFKVSTMQNWSACKTVIMCPSRLSDRPRIGARS